MADRGRILDLLIIGGGINGTAIARDAVGRGLKLALFEQDDLGQHTTANSLKLTEPPARETLAERERLRRIAPHLISRLDVIQTRPPQRAGFFLQKFNAPRKRKLSGNPATAVLKPAYRDATPHTDDWAEDNRLVILNAMDAAARGAKIFPRTKIISITPQDGLWKAETASQSFHARAIVIAAGAAANKTLSSLPGTPRINPPLVKISHIITKQLYPENHAFLLKTSEPRGVYVIPYEREFSLIGGVEIPYDSTPEAATVSEEETAYLCASVNHYFVNAITPDDIIWTYAGVTPRLDAGQEDLLHLAENPATPPLLSVHGGTIINYRKLAERAVDKLLPALGREPGKHWTAGAALPGGDTDDIAAFARMFRAFNTHLDGATTRRLAYTYGTRVNEFVQPHMGHDFGAGLTRAEVDYLVRHEWARTAEDILWRRTKLGLHVPADTEQRLTAYLARDRF
jgi:glycerol-3-phosphate dehydrogenase